MNNEKDGRKNGKWLLKNEVWKIKKDNKSKSKNKNNEKI